MPETAEASKTTPTDVQKGGEVWAPLTALRQDMERLLDDFGQGRWPVQGAMRLMAEMPPVPAMDLVESDGHYEFSLEIPGMSTGDIEVKVSGQNLTIRGEKRVESERKDKDCHFTERRYGRFQRSIRLPDDADPDQIDAHARDGVLTVSVAKRADAERRERKVDISTG